VETAASENGTNEPLPQGILALLLRGRPLSLTSTVRTSAASVSTSTSTRVAPEWRRVGQRLAQHREHLFSPRPSGQWWISLISSVPRPTGMNSMRRWSSPMTPSAPYLASTRSTAASTMRRSIASSSRPDPIATTASRSPCIRSLVPSTASSRACSSESRSSRRSWGSRPPSPAFAMRFRLNA
jgi:hypothetical protein